MDQRGHHQHGGLVNAAALHYLLQDPDNAAFARAVIIWGFVLGWGGTALAAVFWSAQCLAQGDGCEGPHEPSRMLWLVLGGSAFLALGWMLHGWRWRAATERRAYLRAVVDHERQKRWRFEEKVATVANDADLGRLRALWSEPEVSLVDNSWVGGVMDRWLVMHPATYGSQQQARASTPTRLCECPPNSNHADCDPPQVGMSSLESELDQLSSAGAIPSYLTSLRLRAFASVVVVVWLLSAFNPPEIFPSNSTSYADTGAASAPELVPASPEPVDTEPVITYEPDSSSASLSVLLGTATLPVYLYAAKGQPDALKVTVRQTRKVIEADGTVTVTATVRNDGSTPVHPAIALVFARSDYPGFDRDVAIDTWGGEAEPDSGHCIAPGGSAPISWSGEVPAEYDQVLLEDDTTSSSDC